MTEFKNINHFFRFVLTFVCIVLFLFNFLFVNITVAEELSSSLADDFCTSTDISINVKASFLSNKIAELFDESEINTTVQIQNASTVDLNNVSIHALIFRKKNDDITYNPPIFTGKIATDITLIKNSSLKKNILFQPPDFLSNGEYYIELLFIQHDSSAVLSSWFLSGSNSDRYYFSLNRTNQEIHLIDFDYIELDFFGYKPNSSGVINHDSIIPSSAFDTFPLIVSVENPFKDFPFQRNVTVSIHRGLSIDTESVIASTTNITRLIPGRATAFTININPKILSDFDTVLVSDTSTGQTEILGYSVLTNLPQVTFEQLLLNQPHLTYAGLIENNLLSCWSYLKYRGVSLYEYALNYIFINNNQEISYKQNVFLNSFSQYTSDEIEVNHGASYILISTPSNKKYSLKSISLSAFNAFDSLDKYPEDDLMQIKKVAINNDLASYTTEFKSIEESVFKSNRETLIILFMVSIFVLIIVLIVIQGKLKLR